MEQYLEKFKNCLQKEIPYCAAECPFNFDILDFIDKMKTGRYKAAYRAYRNAVGFPLIASSLCPEPCKAVCPRKKIDSSIELGMLEKASISFAEDMVPTEYNLPIKRKKIAIIGAGISGLACALRLCVKKYEVDIFEATEQIGGQLWKLMPAEIFMKDIEEQFKHEKYTLRLNTFVQTPNDLSGANFNAVYVATGENGVDFGLNAQQGDEGDPYCSWYEDAGWFAGGALIGATPVNALAGGLSMGMVIDNFLKTGNLLYPHNKQHTAMCLNPAKLKYTEPVLAASGEAFDREEAIREADRCIECQCDFCRTYCDLTEFYNKWPLRIRDEVAATILPGSSEVKATPARRLLSTCNQCGLCKETCPEDIDIGGLILEGRKSMHQQRKAPWVFHDFWLKDMDFANGNDAAVVKRSKFFKQNSISATIDDKYAFFPGCQLGASDPDLVVKTYSYLLSKHEDIGLFLRCCGVPAEWSGDEEKHKNEIEILHTQWNALGNPILIMACPTCEKKFKTYMADIPVISLYEILSVWGVEASNTVNAERSKTKVFSVFDPCSAMHEGKMKAAVRNLAENAGYVLEPLPENDSFARCCSYGGQSAIANPEYAEFVTQKRISESSNPYITYCINCRDIFSAAGKDAVHILDIILRSGKAPEKLATITERRDNRIDLKKRLLREFWNMEIEKKQKEYNLNVIIPDALAKKLSKARILEDDIIDVIDFCQKTGRRVYHPEKNIYSGYREVGYMTYWVEYREIPGAETYELINAYAHRMKIELEVVWNGKKTDLAMR